MNDWISTKTKMPPVGEVVDTKIDDDLGARNHQELVFERNLWFFPNRSMYVYYQPTHWRPSGGAS